jgi:hypothetical protein
MRKYLLFVLLASLLPIQACSVIQATSGPDTKDLSVLDIGTNRYRVLAELGEPLVSEEDDNGFKVDVFSFVQGTSGGFRAGRGIFYGLLAVGTLGISEVITSPIEGAIGDGAEIQVKVSYDEEDLVNEIEVLRDERWIPIQELEDASEEASSDL